MESSIGFIVNGIVTDDETYWHVIGRCGDGSIRIGDVFESVDLPGAAAVESSESASWRPVRLRVERIQAYQQEMSELGSGMTGTIDLCGTGLELLIPGAVLGEVNRADSPAAGSARTHAEGS
jgi:predicted Zn-dependent protease